MVDSFALHLIEEFENEYPDAVRLAKVVSLAVQVEPELLRKARLELLPGVYAGAEADLWFSPLVQSENALAFVLLPEVVEILRWELSKEQKLLDQAWHVLRKVHKDIPPVIKLEEELIWLTLSMKSTPFEIEQRLQSVIVSMVTEYRIGLARWVARALPRLPQKAHQSQAFWLLAITAGARLGGKQILASGEIPIMLTWEQLRWALPEDLPHIPIGVRLLEDGIQFGNPSMIGAHIIELPKVSPLLLEISWQMDTVRHTQQVSWVPPQTKTVRVHSNEIMLRTVLGDTYFLRSKQEIKGYTEETFIGKLEDALNTILSQEFCHIEYFWKTDKNLNELERMIVSSREDEPLILSINKYLGETKEIRMLTEER